MTLREAGELVLKIEQFWGEAAGERAMLRLADGMNRKMNTRTAEVRDVPATVTTTGNETPAADRPVPARSIASAPEAAGVVGDKDALDAEGHNVEEKMRWT